LLLPFVFVLVLLWFCCGFVVVLLWFCCGFVVVLFWFCCGFGFCFIFVSVFFFFFLVSWCYCRRPLSHAFPGAVPGLGPRNHNGIKHIALVKELNPEALFP
jgi:hypothetical protein